MDSSDDDDGGNYVQGGPHSSLCTQLCCYKVLFDENPVGSWALTPKLAICIDAEASDFTAAHSHTVPAQTFLSNLQPSRSAISMALGSGLLPVLSYYK